VNGPVGDNADTGVAVLDGVAASVKVAVAELDSQFAGYAMTVTPDGAGGVFVVIDGLDPGAPYLDAETWLGFQITSVYPDADVYPHFSGRLRRIDHSAHGEGMSETEWLGRPALQLSRRSNRWNSATDTATLKALKVITWLASR
jgi:hypothetical protein